MPLTSVVVAVTEVGPQTAGQYLAAVAAGTAEPADVVVVPVEGDGAVAP